MLRQDCHNELQCKNPNIDAVDDILMYCIVCRITLSDIDVDGNVKARKNVKAKETERNPFVETNLSECRIDIEESHLIYI